MVLMILPLAYAQCLDSDQVGLSLYTQGSVEYEGETYVDYCTGIELTEYKCEDNTMAVDKMNCDYGCLNGACLDASDIDCSGLKKSEFTNDQIDYCYNNNQMKNYFCTGNQASYQIVDCQYGCDQGHCLAESKKPANCQGFNYQNSCGDLVVDDCLHCGFDCGDYQCVEVLDLPCGMGATGVCLKLDNGFIRFRKFSQEIAAQVDGSLDFSGNRVRVNGINLQTYPDKIYAKIAEAGYGINNIKLRAGDMTYSVEAVKDVKVFGLFSKQMKVNIEVGSLPNSEISVDKPWWGFLAW